MTTGIERITAKARKEPRLRFTTLTHHVDKDLIRNCLAHISISTAVGVDGKDVKSTKEDFDTWVEVALDAIHRQGYRPPAVRRVYIPKPGKTEKRPLGVPCVADRAIQRAVSSVLSALYEADFLPCSFGGRPNLSAHHALCTFNEIVAGKKISWVYEADLKNFFGSLDHGWMLRFVEHRVGDPRIISLVRRWLKAGVFENGIVTMPEEGTPQGGSISVLLSNVYLHYVLDLWFTKVVKPRMKGECYLIRYLDDFLVCFQFRSDATRFQNVLPKRLAKFGLALEPQKTKLVEFGRFTQRHAKERGTKPETVYFLGFTHYCTKNRKGNFQVGRKTEKVRFRRSVFRLREFVHKIQHWKLQDQANSINQVLRGHYGYYGLGGNQASLHRFHRIVEVLWRKSLSKRCWKGKVIWEEFNRLKGVFPLQRPKLRIPYLRMQLYAVL